MLELCVERKELLAPQRPKVQQMHPGPDTCALLSWSLCLHTLRRARQSLAALCLDNSSLVSETCAVRTPCPCACALDSLALGRFPPRHLKFKLYRCSVWPDWYEILPLQDADTRQLLQMWYTGRASLLAVVLTYVLSNTSAKLGAGDALPPQRPFTCLCWPKSPTSSAAC